MLDAKRAEESHTSDAPLHVGTLYFTEETEALGKYTAKWQTNKPYISIGELKKLSWCTVVSDHDDLSTGGVVHDPDEKAILPK